MSDGRSGDEHLADWARLHMTEPPGAFVGGWLKAVGAVARPLAAAGVSPNVITIAALVTALAAVPLATIDGWVGPAAACAAVVVSGLLDALDGAVAVQAGRATRVGFLLDSVLDRLADAAFPGALAIVAGRSGGPLGPAGDGVWVVAIAAVAACWWLEYIRVRASLAVAAEPPPAPAWRQQQVVTPGERPTRIILTAVGLGIPALALVALWAHVLIVGGSALFLLAHSLVRLHRGAAPPTPRGGSGE